MAASPAPFSLTAVPGIHFGAGRSGALADDVKAAAPDAARVLLVADAGIGAMLGTGENRAHLPLMDAIAIDLAVMEPDGPDDAMGKEAGARFVPHTGEGRNVAIFRNPARKGAEIGRAHV